MNKLKAVKNTGLELVCILNDFLKAGQPEKDFLSRLLELFEESLLNEHPAPQERLDQLIQWSCSKKIIDNRNAILSTFIISFRTARSLLRNDN